MPFSEPDLLLAVPLARQPIGGERLRGLLSQDRAREVRMPRDVEPGAGCEDALETVLEVGREVGDVLGWGRGHGEDLELCVDHTISSISRPPLIRSSHT